MTLVRKDKTGGFLEVFNYKDLLVQLVSRDLKLKYRRSVLGYVWSVLNPLLIMIVMYVVFSKLFDRNIPNFPVYLLVGRTLYDFIVGATNKAMDGITSNYLDYAARDANCEYYDTESCTMKSGHFRLDPSVRFVMERDNGKKKFAESTMTFIEY